MELASPEKAWEQHLFFMARISAAATGGEILRNP